MLARNIPRAVWHEVMAHIKHLALILILLLPPAQTVAAPKPGQDNAEILYKNCGTSANKWSQSYCFRYVIDIVDSAKQEGRPLAVCQPKGATKGEVVDAVRTWLANRPEERRKSALSLIARALSDTWPCR